MHRGQKHIYLLIGPKGSGKSYIGALIHNYFNIPFVRVEEWALEVRNGRNLDDPEYHRDIFHTIELRIREAINEVDYLVFESTGITDYFDQMLIQMKVDYQVTTIKIIADLETCKERILSRDPSIHVNVSDDLIEEIHTVFLLKDFTPDYSIENIGKSSDKLKEEIRVILYHTTNAIP